ncbi:MAG TPA: hypothetical protein VNK52_17200 [Hyphomicrobiaceae bacterium]|nr:hypothetical protein [Hyphomicrobiaceae bacterium]
MGIATRTDPRTEVGPDVFVPAVLVFFTGWLAFSWPWLSGAVTIPWDAKAHFLPQVQFMAASLARGESVFWNPYVFAGSPQIADPQSLIFSPPMLLLALIDSAPGGWAVDTAVLLSVLASGIGVLLLFRDQGWHPAGGLIGALAFSFGAAMAWRLQHVNQVLSLAYLPFAILLLRRALLRQSLIYGLAAGIVAGFIVASRDQVALLETYLLVGYVLAHWLSSERWAAAARASVKPLLAGAISGAAVALVPVALTLLLAELSNRPEIDYIGAGRGSLHPALLITSVMPHLFGAAGDMAEYWGPPSFAWSGTGLFIAQNVGQLYIGAVPLLMLVIGVARGILWHSEIRFFTIALIVALLYALGWYTPAFRVFYEVLPGVSFYRRPADAVFLIGGLAALLAGYVAHCAFTWQLPPSRIWQHCVQAAVPLCALLAGLGLAVGFGRVGTAAGAIVLSAICFLVGAAAIGAAQWLRPVRPLAALVLLGTTVAADLAVNNGPNGASGLPPSVAGVLEPDTDNATIALLKRKVAETSNDTRRDRVELAGLGFHWPNASITHRLEQTLGYNPVRVRLYAAATGAQDTVGLPEQRTFAPLFPSYRSLMADLLGLRFIATGVPIESIDKSLRPGDLTLIARTGDGYVYENPRALPRVMLVPNAMTADFNDLLTTGQWPSFDPNTTVLLEAAETTAERPSGWARIVTYLNSEVIIEAESPAGGFVVLNDVWFPWWRAEVDGRPAPILRANVIFRAVAVPPGRHTVRMIFKPLSGALAQALGR